MLQIPTFVANLSKTVKEEETKITNSSLTISTIVDILINVANTIQVADVSQDVIQASKTESLKEKKRYCTVSQLFCRSAYFFH